MPNPSRGPYVNCPNQGRLPNHNSRLAITDRIILRPSAGGELTPIAMMYAGYEDYGTNYQKHIYVPYSGDVYVDIDVGMLWNQVSETYIYISLGTPNPGVNWYYGGQSAPAWVTVWDGEAEHEVIRYTGSISISFASWYQASPYRYFTVYSNTTGNQSIVQTSYEGNINKIYLYRYVFNSANFNRIWNPTYCYEN